MFAAAKLMVLTNIDLLPHLNFDMASCMAYARRVMPHPQPCKTASSNSKPNGPNSRRCRRRPWHVSWPGGFSAQRLAAELGVLAFAVQHHHGHIAAAMAEHGCGIVQQHHGTLAAENLSQGCGARFTLTSPLAA